MLDVITITPVHFSNQRHRHKRIWCFKYLFQICYNSQWKNRNIKLFHSFFYFFVFFLSRLKQHSTLMVAYACKQSKQQTHVQSSTNKENVPLRQDRPLDCKTFPLMHLQWYLLSFQSSTTHSSSQWQLSSSKSISTNPSSSLPVIRNIQSDFCQEGSIIMITKEF